MTVGERKMLNCVNTGGNVYEADGISVVLRPGPDRNCSATRYPVFLVLRPLVWLMSRALRETSSRFRKSIWAMSDSSVGPASLSRDCSVGPPFFSASGSLAGNKFTTILSPNPTATIDDLRITMRMSFTSYNIDNIQLTPGAFVIPEPSSLVSLTPCLLCVGVRFRSRSHKKSECLQESAEG